MKLAKDTIPHEYVLYNGQLIRRIPSKRLRFQVVAKTMTGTMISNNQLNSTKHLDGKLSVRFEYITLEPDTEVTTLVDL